MFKKIVVRLALVLAIGLSTNVKAIESSFDAITFDPAIDSGNYFTVYGSQNLKAWQGTVGLYIDYAHKPLQFVGIGSSAGEERAVIDDFVVGNIYGALGLTDWAQVGINIPAVFYNWYFNDDATGDENHAPGMGDIKVVGKFRILNNEKRVVGISVIPFITLPTGDSERYVGNGDVAGGATAVVDFNIHKRFSLSLNAGVNARNDVTKHGVNIDDQFLYSVGANFKATQNFHIIAEAYGSTNLKNMFEESSESPLEIGGGLRYIFGDSGFTADLGGTAGVIEGVGSPSFRVFAGLKWTSPIPVPCEKCAVPEPCPTPQAVLTDTEIKILGKIFFDTARTTLKSESFPTLNDVVTIMQEHSEIRMVEIQGHTDARGSDTYNQKLSQGRAESVKNYLVQKGIDPSRLTAKGYGESQPIADNTTKEGMSQNRRVQFMILEKSSQ